ncbi:MAG: SpoIVB peptidase S55 domain-containing protein [Actinomycetota bacterium]
MMRLRKSSVPGRRLMTAVVGSAAVLSLTAMVVPAPADPTCTSAQLPAVYPEDQLQEGQVATGYTVIHGTTRESFQGKILGVLHDQPLPGVDVILVQLSGAVIDETGGAAYGMSGSPFFIDGKFVGALIYGPPGGYGDQTIAGLMPAQRIVDLFGYPQGASTAKGTYPRSVRLSPTARRDAARVAGGSASGMPASLEQLRVPLAVSGLNDRGMRKLSKVLTKLHLPVVPYRASSASAAQPATAPQPFQPGDAASAVVSYGDVSLAGIGTVAATCGSDDVLFGHSLYFDGPTTLGLNGANIITVVKDPSGLIGPYKVGEVTDLHGVLDQDRFSGLRGTEAGTPPRYPVTVGVTNADLGTTRTGETDIVKQGVGASSPFAGIAPFAVLAEQDVAFDRLGSGTDTMSWTLTGTTSDGEPWSLTRENIVWSAYDASFDGIIELLNDLYQLASNDFTDVTFSALDWQSTMTDEQRSMKITDVSWATPGSDGFSSKHRIMVQPGQRIRLHVELTPFGETTPKVVRVTVVVPSSAQSGGNLLVRGGQAGGGGFGIAFGKRTAARSGQPKTFEDLVDQLARDEHNSDLVVQFDVPGGRGGADEVRRAQDAVVLGQRSFVVEVGGNQPPSVCSAAKHRC